MPSFGENLRRERELRGVDLHDMAETTKISVRFLQALEQDRVEVLPGGIFRRSFVRQYARYLGLDPEKLVAEFVHVHDRKPPERIPPVRPKPRRRPGPREVLMAAAAVALGGLTLLVLRQPYDAAPQAPAASASALPAARQPGDRVYPAPSSHAVAAAAPEVLVLTLSARESCWVAAQVDGQTVLNRVLTEGETQTLEAEGEIILSVGNAGGLSFKVNDRPGVPLGRQGEVRRNIVITRQSLPSLIEEAAPPASPHSG